ncbi:MAG: hypothetical protein ABSA23_02090 [Anaerolineales bacterium]|jgi:hypothetical protein
MQSIAFSEIEMRGELGFRASLNYTRLEGPWYRPDEVFQADKHGWPGDWEGRVILALTLLAQSTHRTPAFLEQILSLIPAHLNSKGYFGQIMPEGKYDEQHLSGHSWILRGLCEYYLWKRNENVKNILDGILKNYILKTKGAFAKYPIDPKTRFQDPDWILSKLQTKTRHHAETSDAGCAFILIDGVTQAYEVFKTQELKEFADEIIDRFMQLDFLGLHIQTHATLSGIRGMLRMYDLTRSNKYLDNALKVFNFYKKEAWTEAYGNYNWFGAPRWTESCGIIDSFIVATCLWKYTKDPVYLEDAHHIYFNALSHGNRINGSFGTDRCCGAVDTEDNQFLHPINYETYWCCTMRGGEGFARAIEYSFFIDKDTVYIPYFHNCLANIKFSDGEIKLEEKTDYPYFGNVSFEVMEANAARAKTIKIFAPSWTQKEKIAVKLNGKNMKTLYEKDFLVIEAAFKTGDKIEFDLGLTSNIEDTAFKNSIKGFHKYTFGPLVLGVKSKVEINTLEGNKFENYAESKYKSSQIIAIKNNAELERLNRNEFKVKGTDIILTCLCDVKDMTQEDTLRQVLFAD